MAKSLIHKHFLSMRKNFAHGQNCCVLYGSLGKKPSFKGRSGTSALLCTKTVDKIVSKAAGFTISR